MKKKTLDALKKLIEFEHELLKYHDALAHTIHNNLITTPSYNIDANNLLGLIETEDQLLDYFYDDQDGLLKIYSELLRGQKPSDSKIIDHFHLIDENYLMNISVGDRLFRLFLDKKETIDFFEIEKQILNPFNAGKYNFKYVYYQPKEQITSIINNEFDSVFEYFFRNTVANNMVPNNLSCRELINMEQLFLFSRPIIENDFWEHQNFDSIPAEIVSNCLIDDLDISGNCCKYIYDEFTKELINNSIDKIMSSKDQSSFDYGLLILHLQTGVTMTRDNDILKSCKEYYSSKYRTNLDLNDSDYVNSASIISNIFNAADDLKSSFEYVKKIDY